MTLQKRTQNSNLVKVYIDGVAVAGQKDASINRGTSTVDITTKDNDGWNDYEAGQNEWSADFGGLVILNDAGYEALLNAWRTKKKVAVKYGTEEEWEEGMALITSLPSTAPTNDRTTFSCSLTGCGELVPKKAEVEDVVRKVK